MPSLLLRAAAALCLASSCASAFAPSSRTVPPLVKSAPTAPSTCTADPAVADSGPLVVLYSTDADRNSYSEQSRAFRRTVYTFDDWVKHRSPDRFFRILGKITQSGLLRSLGKEVSVIAAVATAIVVWNHWIAGEYTDLGGMAHPGALADWGLPLLGLPLTPFTLSSPSLGLLLVFRTNTAYTRWDEARKAWGLNINRSRDLVRMATVWSASKVEPEDAITRMDPKWMNGQVDEGGRIETLRRLSKCVWAFQRSLMNRLSTPDDEPLFQSELYDRLDPKMAKGIIKAEHRANRAMHEISMTINELPLHFLRKIEVDKDVVQFEDTAGGCERLFTSPVPIFYTRHTARFLSAWLLLLPLGLYDSFKGTWNHAGLIPAMAVISIFLFGIEELAVQLEEPFSILPMQGFCDKIGRWCDEIVEWDPNEFKRAEVQTRAAAVPETTGAGAGTYSPIPGQLT